MTPEGQEEAADRLVAAVQSSAKYAGLAESFIWGVGRRELAKGRSFKEAVKSTKNKLHQVAGAYLSKEMGYAETLAVLQAAVEAKDQEAIEQACRQAMHRHASTRERLDFVDRFYADIFAALPPVRSVLDIACGLNPLAIPWMPLAEGTRYYAVDIYLDMMEFLSSFFKIMNIRGAGLAEDVIESPPPESVDLALVLKTIPCLEQADRTAGARLLESLNARHILVSFPAQSLGGRGKGMPENYEKHFFQLVSGKGWKIRRFEYPTELAFLAST
jgi:16S rRNA (guanine(1405)-N(7))-methyltransferase